jgi:hypothetical protein
MENEKNWRLISAIETKLVLHRRTKRLCLIIGVLSLVTYLLLGLPNARCCNRGGRIGAVPLAVSGAIPAGLLLIYSASINLWCCRWLFSS